MKKHFLMAAAAVAMITATGASATDCTRQTIAGKWFGGDSFAVCRVKFRGNGKIRGLCKEEDEYFDDNGQLVTEIQRFRITGRLQVDSDCKAKMRLRARSDDGSERLVLEGRFAGAASSRPDIAVLSTNIKSPPFLNFTFHRQ